MNKDYYVYFHRNSLTNEVFYVGKGRGNRCYATGVKRSKQWREYIENNKCGFIVEKVAEGLTDDEAKAIEFDYLNTLSNLVNVKKDNKWHEDLLYVSKHFEYSPDSPTFLLWKTPLKTSKRKVGDVAGCMDSNGYVRVTLNMKLYLAHRIIWVIFNNRQIPDGMVINHKDCNPSNNAIENLECVSFCDNNRRKKHNVSGKTCSTNTSGTNGVYLGKDMSGYISWRAFIYHDDTLSTKSFSVNKYGYDGAHRLACEWRKQMEEKYYDSSQDNKQGE